MKEENVEIEEEPVLSRIRLNVHVNIQERAKALE